MIFQKIFNDSVDIKNQFQALHDLPILIYYYYYYAICSKTIFF